MIPDFDTLHEECGVFGIYGTPDKQRTAVRIGLLDHHDGVGAARQHAAGRDGHGGSGSKFGDRHNGRGDRFVQ